MTRRLSTAITVACFLAVPAYAQQPAAVVPAASTRCGGILCDLYYANKPAPAPGQPDVPDPTHLPCRDFLCAAFGGRTPEPPPPAVEQAAAEPQAEPVKTAKHKRKARRTVASADTTKIEPAK